MMSYAIIRGANGRRHEVDFEGAEIKVDVTVGTALVQITIEATKDSARSDQRRFATMAIPREQFAASLGADLKSREKGPGSAPLQIVPRED